METLGEMTAKEKETLSVIAEDSISNETLDAIRVQMQNENFDK